MRKITIWISALLMIICFSACNTVSAPNSDPIETSSAAGDGVSDIESTSAPLGDEEGIGGSPFRNCLNHCFSYHSIDGRLIDEYVGQDIVNAWVQKEEALGHRISILSFIEKFEIPKDVLTYYTRDSVSDSLLEALEITRQEYYQQYGYTLEQIDALYSGDESQINEAFCGPLAVFNETDGTLYTIEWLSEHTAADYVEAGLPLDRVEEVIDLAQTEEYVEYASLAEEAQSVFTAAAALEAEMAVFSSPASEK